MTGDFNEAASRQYEQPIAEALAGFTDLTFGDVTFGPEAARLRQLPGEDRPASDPAAVQYSGKTVGSLTTMLFRYYDGTGNRAADRLDDSTGKGYFLEAARTLPSIDERDQAIHGDVHLAIAAFEARGPDFNPRPFAGSLSLFGRFRTPVELGYLGQNNLDFHAAMSGELTPAPAATKTITPQRLDPSFAITPGGRWANDLRAVYNRYMGIFQIAAFIKLDRDPEGRITRTQANMLHRLGAQRPVPGKAHQPVRALQRR